ncbi:hypothetical protein [Acetivibrio cellulolyticus]|uniref:hypothetical protein n=1 Tax=Acetivibrio cellulolyticus TaxID=35830 RepID=UPI0001E2CBEC|nr:hypothetical protein [Acetivibrio cellulolyticus]
MKKGVVLILAVLLTVCAGFLVPILLNRDSTTRDNPEGGLSETKTPVKLSTQRVDNEVINEATSDVRLETPSVSASTKYTSDVSLVIPTPSATPKTTEVDNGVESAESVVTDGKGIEPTPAKTEKATSGSWVDRKIEEHRDEIDPNDLADFRRIYSSVNIGYIQGLMDDGLDDEETTQLKAYLKNTLGGDYERAKELFYEYSYLLSEV